MIATGLPIPLRDEEVLQFVDLHGTALAARLLGMSQRGLNAVLRDIAQRGQPARPEPAAKAASEVSDDEIAATMRQSLKPGPTQKDQDEAAGPPVPAALPNAAAPEPNTNGAGPATASAFKDGDLVEVILPGPHLGKRGLVERLKAEGVVVRLDGVGKRLCKSEQIRKVPTRPRGPCPEVRRLMTTVLKGKPRAAIRAFRTLTTLNEMNDLALVRRMIELSRTGRPGVAAAAAQVLAAAHRAKRRRR